MTIGVCSTRHEIISSNRHVVSAMPILIPGRTLPCSTIGALPTGGVWRVESAREDTCDARIRFGCPLLFADKGAQMEVYQNLMQVPEYRRFDPFKPEENTVFTLRDGRCQQIEWAANGELASPLLGLQL
jgi:hypothetical protein